MALAAGTRLGVYEVTGPLGVGGMGEVYRARDTKLGRDVALKILPDALAADEDRLMRFEREARTLASINHPHIAQIHGFEEQGRVRALVMELVEGEDLAHRIARGAIPVDEALPIARQLAEALESAHELGIIHRDLKPANIKVREDGTVKVLDFGLAKTLDGGPRANPDVTQSPTITAPALLTSVGAIVGTAAYMSPEQVRGRAADKRSDIWAFGCVLYEMLTGSRAFGGDAVPIVLAAVATTPPDLDAIVNQPPALRRLVRQCLEKDPKRRLQAIGDARVQIDELMTGSAGEFELPLRPRVSWGRRVAAPAAVALIASLATVTAVWFTARPAGMQLRVSRLNITPPATAALSVGVSRDVAITSDGSRVVYAGANGTALFVRAFDQLEERAIVRGAAPRHPFLSPDGQWVGFFDGGLAIKKVPINGGPSVLITRLDSFERGATWAADGSIIFATQSPTAGLQRVSADGGPVTVLTRPDRPRGEVGHAWPEMLPDGRAVLYSVLPQAGGLDAASLALLDLGSGQSTILMGGGTHAQYVDGGYLLYGVAGALRAIGFDAGSKTIVGSSIPVVPQVVTTAFGGVDAVLSREGTLVYVTGGGGSGAGRVLAWADRERHEVLVSAPPRGYYFPRIAPDGGRIAVNAVVEQNSDIWVWDLTRAALSRFTSDPALDAFPEWTPDGRRIVFGSNRAGVFNLFSQAADGTDSVERLTESPDSQYPSGITPDGKLALFTDLAATTGYDVMAVTLDGTRRVRALVQTRFDERNGIVSRDARWLAYEANDTGAFEIYVRPFPEVSGGHWQISTDGGRQPLWSPDGRELFYFAPDGALMHVAVDATSSWKAGAPGKVLDTGYVVSTGGNLPRNYDIARDSRRFLMLKVEGRDALATPPQMVVVQHFNEELKRLLPVK